MKQIQYQFSNSIRNIAHAQNEFHHLLRNKIIPGEILMEELSLSGLTITIGVPDNVDTKNYLLLLTALKMKQLCIEKLNK